MPNHVTHRIVFSAEHADRVFSDVCPNGKFDFNILIPMPPQIYMSNVSRDDEEDFKCNCLSWGRENWGTKWNCYRQSAFLDGNASVIQFDTAWSIPYPVISAFCNRFQIPFEHRYYDEGGIYWGIETWGNREHEDGRIGRVSKQKNIEVNRRSLCVELKGYDPDIQDDD